jgi:NAD+ synthase
MKTDKLSLHINPDLARKIIVKFIESEITRVGFSRAVVALSGGVDSSLTCLLTVEAMGSENVLAVLMPYESSSPKSLEHAQLVVDATKVQQQTIPITPMAQPLIERIPEQDLVRRGNVMARTRMTVIYDQSAAFGGLVVGTGNKTEILLGYTTQYGDAACAINPLGDLYKSQVRQLAQSVGLPEVILEKVPSADLWPGQTDEGELGFTYDEVDRLLLYLIDGRYSPEACIEMGFDANFVQEVMERVRKNHFKRIMPIIAKLSDRTVGYDFLYLRDWGT